MAKWRTIQPAHKSDKITVQQAMKAWRKVEGKNQGKVAKSVSKHDASGRGHVAADRHR